MEFCFCLQCDYVAYLFIPDYWTILRYYEENEEMIEGGEYLY
jgi:hypothetical protein